MQLAKYFGAIVTAVCGTNNAALTKSLGADFIIDYTKETFLWSKDLYDIILAINGNYPFFACRRILTGSGRYVMIGGAFAQIFKSLLFGWASSFGSKKMYFLAANTNHQDLSFLAKLVDEGVLKPVIDRCYSLEKAAEAMGYISSCCSKYAATGH